MKRLTPAEKAANRNWTLKAWVISSLPSDQIAAVLTSPSPPTISELIALAREHAEKYAGKCPHCGKPLPVERATRAKRKRKKVSFVTATKRGLT